MQIEPGYLHGATAIQWLSSDPGPRVGWRGNVVEADVKEGSERDHVLGHTVGPFEHPRSNVDQKGVRGPTSQDHDLGC